MLKNIVRVTRDYKNSHKIIYRKFLYYILYIHEFLNGWKKHARTQVYGRKKLAGILCLINLSSTGLDEFIKIQHGYGFKLIFLKIRFGFQLSQRNLFQRNRLWIDGLIEYCHSVTIRCFIRNIIYFNTLTCGKIPWGIWFCLVIWVCCVTLIFYGKFIMIIKHIFHFSYIRCNNNNNNNMLFVVHIYI